MRILKGVTPLSGGLGAAPPKAFALEFRGTLRSLREFLMTTPATTSSTVIDSDVEKEPLDAQTRLILLGAGAVALLVLFGIGLAIFVMVVNNWNFLNWME